MPNVPIRVYDRLVASLRRFQPILSAAKSRDAGEADTSTIVKDILSEVFGYDKYTEITSEYAIKGTYCDLAVRLEGKLHLLVEVKAIGLDLKDAHTKQAVDYAANQGVDWVVLTNGGTWRIYRVTFGQPIGQELVYECDLLSMSPKARATVESLFLLAREGQAKSVLHDYHTQRQAMSRYHIGGLILGDAVTNVIRRELGRISPGVRIDVEELRDVLLQEVLKREVVEGEKAEEARRKIARTQSRALKVRAAATSIGGDASPAESVDTTAAER
ncbi:MAG: type I restriction enzyme HsdR N-terminal domain-containing protein [Bryobacteraceae bacterium]